MKRLVMCALLAAGCGLPIPTDGATECGRKVYLEVGVDTALPLFGCPGALSEVRNAEQIVGVDMASVTVEFMAGETLESIGHANAWGATQAGTVAVVATHANTMIHEAFHVRDGQSDHCNWSVDKLPTLEANYVGGSFDDKCRHVHCTSTNAWQDGTGQWFGNRYECTPIP